MRVAISIHIYSRAFTVTAELREALIIATAFTAGIKTLFKSLMCDASFHIAPVLNLRCCSACSVESRRFICCLTLKLLIEPTIGSILKVEGANAPRSALLSRYHCDRAGADKLEALLLQKLRIYGVARQDRTYRAGSALWLRESSWCC